jgi:hypothetical protein
MTSIGQPTVYGSILPPLFTKLNIDELYSGARFCLRFFAYYLKRLALCGSDQTCRYLV